MSRIGSSLASKSNTLQNSVNTRRDRVGGEGRSGMKADFEKAAIAAGIDPSKLKQIESQIQSELKRAQANPGSGFSLGAAIDSALKAGGANLDTFHAEMQKLHDLRHSRSSAITAPSANTKATEHPIESGKLDIAA